MPLGGTALILGCVFCLFASLMLVAAMMRGARAPVSQTLFVAFISGIFAAGMLFGFVRRLIKFSIVWLGVFIIAQAWLPQTGQGRPPQSLDDRAQLLDRIKIEGALAAATIIAAYALVLAFLQKEGERVFAHITEVRLAQEVHQTLVPGLAQKVGGYEIYGASVPSGQVGGDLVDLVEAEGGWMAYVADVSGHGVPAGMIMAMVKSAVRMGSTDRTFPDFLQTLNRVLLSLLAPNVFVTFSCVAGNSGPDLTFALAGHLPVLHYRRCQGVVEERSVSNLPLAILPDAEFATAKISCEPGDLLVILTDGLTEAADKQGLELGLEPLKAVMLSAADFPLEQIVHQLRATSLQRGKQTDDQTVLLVRREHRNAPIT